MHSSSSAAHVEPDLTLDQSARETVESIVVAIILAFLFRGFIAEAFVIPTGSMAPTLQGRHMDVVCAECGFQYRTGASIENDETGPPRGEVTVTRCPLCRYAMELGKENDLNQRSFNGDRILVSKFAYQFREPRRWDVIVFKYPGNAKVNYIKRLVGLPGETLRIRHGDIYLLDPATRDEPENRQRFEIERKPPDKVLALLQLVDDSRFASARMKSAGWPSRWKAQSADGWQTDGSSFSLANRSSTAWMRYQHLLPRRNDWRAVGHGDTLQFDSDYAGHLITDYYAYNDTLSQFDENGSCWVGDLAVEADVDIRRGDGELILDLVEGGRHYSCTISATTGQARLAIDQGRESFQSRGGQSVRHPVAATAVKGTGSHRLKFANIDDQLHLWVDDRLMKFDSPTTFVSPVDLSPQWSANDTGDLQPVGIAARGLEIDASKLRVFRDIYYRAVEVDNGPNSEYASLLVRSGDDIDTIMSRPKSWRTTDLFASRRSVTFKLEADQFFPMGDNSPQSKDARLWSNGNRGIVSDDPPPYVERELLIGRALAIYWPHGWRVGTGWIGIIPNFQRIGLIR